MGSHQGQAVFEAELECVLQNPSPTLTSRALAPPPTLHVSFLFTLPLHYPPLAVSFEDARNLAQRSGFLPEQFEDFVSQYEGLNIIQVNASRTRIDLAT